MRYSDLDLPCINRSFMCLHTQFMKEFKTIYPEINYNVPNEVLEKFGEPFKASEQCLVVPLNPLNDIKEAVWICHPDIKVVLNFQLKVTKEIFDANEESFDFVAQYVTGKNKLTDGVVTIDKDKIVFNDMNKSTMLQSDWKDIDPYANAMYLKEELDWKGDAATKPDSGRCLKLFRVSEVTSNNPDIFCINYMKNDMSLNPQISLVQGKYAADMYSDDINIRLQKVAIQQSLMALQKETKKVDIDSKILFPIKMEIRRIYFFERHVIINGVKLGQIMRGEIAGKLEEVKIKTIDSVCAGIELCKNAINFSIDKGLLPLSGKREKFAMDLQNPFNSKMPKINIRINLPKADGLGQKLVTAAAQMIGANSYFAEVLPESPSGQAPNNISIKKAFNTFKSLRESKTYLAVTELGTSCKSSERNQSSEIRRKVSFLTMSGDNDVFFDYLGYIRDFQLSKQ